MVQFISLSLNAIFLSLLSTLCRLILFRLFEAHLNPVLPPILVPLLKKAALGAIERVTWDFEGDGFVGGGGDDQILKPRINRLLPLLKSAHYSVFWA